MRILPILFVLFITASPAHAVKDLYSLCERALTVDAENILPLAPHQIALRGNLDIYWKNGMGNHLGWTIKDEFLSKNISPAQSHNSRLLNNGDQVFILDDQGRVQSSGYFGQRQEEKEVIAGDITTRTSLNFPYLFHDKDLTSPVTEAGEFLANFGQKSRAVVIQTLSPAQLTELQTLLKPSFERYEVNAKQVERFVRVGRRRAVELAHFEVSEQGTLRVEASDQNSQIYNFLTGESEPGPKFRIHAYSLGTEGEMAALKRGDRVFLLDEDDLVTFEARIGSPEMPLHSEDRDAMKAIENKIRQSKKAFVIALRLRKLN